MHRKIKNTLTVIILLLAFSSAYAQTDTLVLNNKNILVGEVKSMDRGVLTMETDYSDSDFKIEWKKIKEIYTDSYFLITLSDGRRYNGTLTMADSSTISIIGEHGTVATSRKDIVYLNSVDSGFWSRLYAGIDLGYSVTKANNLQQLSLRSNIGYLAEKWSADASYNNIFSSQEGIEDVHRIDAGLTYRYYLPKDWFLIGQLSWLSNTEQSIQLRTVSKIGLGKYLIHTNSTYWGVQGGGSFNNEEFSDESLSRQSAEGFFGTELNMYDIGDLNLLTKVVVYPSITESGRWRTDFNFDTKYDLPLDFYIRLGFTLNYDNQPVEGAPNTDYVFQTTFGWEL